MSRILLDIDGCICVYDFPQLVYEKFHVAIDAKKIFAYNLADVLGVSSQSINEMFYKQVWGEPEFSLGALDVLREWAKVGHDIVIYSNRIKYMGLEDLDGWLRKHKIPFNSISPSGLGAFDYHIDDRPEKLCDTNSRVKLLYSQPWNESCLNIENKLTRVHSWREIRHIVR